MDVEWELSKENIQPRKQGRDVDCLITALTPFKNDHRKQIDNERAIFEAKLRTYDGDDPLSIWSGYIAWSEQHFPKDHKNTYTLIEKCIEEILVLPKYQNDERALNIWLKYMDIIEEPLPVFQYMFQKKKNATFANFYIAWAEALENQGNVKKADEVLHLGINRSAEPMSHLKSYLRGFEMRLVQRIKTQDYYDEEDASEKRSALSVLRKDKKGAVSYDRTKTKSRSKELGIRAKEGNTTQAGFTVYQDDENADPSKLLSSSGSWNKPPMQTVTKRENVNVPGQWKKHKIPTATPKASSVVPFSIHVDDTVTTPQRTPSQCALFIERKPLSARKVDKVGKSDKLISNLNKPNEQSKCMIMCDMDKLYSGTEEFAFEEIRAAQYFKMEEELQQLLMDDDKTKVVEINMSTSPDITSAFVDRIKLSPEKDGKDKPVNCEASVTPFSRSRVLQEARNNGLVTAPQCFTDDKPPKYLPERDERNDNLQLSYVEQDAIKSQVRGSIMHSESATNIGRCDPAVYLAEKEIQDKENLISSLSLQEKEDKSSTLSKNMKDLKRGNENPYSPSNHRHGEKEKRFTVFEDDGVTSDFTNVKVHSPSIYTTEACKTVQAWFDATINVDRKEEKQSSFDAKNDIFDKFEFGIFKEEGKSAKRDLDFDIFAEEKLGNSKEVDNGGQKQVQLPFSDDSFLEDNRPFSMFGSKKDDERNDNRFIPIQNNADVSTLSVSGISGFMHEDARDKQSGSRSMNGNAFKPISAEDKDIVGVSFAGHSNSKFGKNDNFVQPTTAQVQNEDYKFTQSCDKLGLRSSIDDDAFKRSSAAFGVDNGQDNKGAEPVIFGDYQDQEDNIGLSMRKPSFRNGIKSSTPFAIFQDPEDEFPSLPKAGTAQEQDLELFCARESREKLPSFGISKSPKQVKDESSFFAVYERTLPVEDSVVAEPFGDQDFSFTLGTLTAVSDGTKKLISSTPYQSKSLGMPADVPSYEHKNRDVATEALGEAPFGTGRVRTLSSSVSDSLLVDNLRKEIDDATAKNGDIPASFQTTYSNFYTHENDLSPIDEGSENSRTIPRVTSESQSNVSPLYTSTYLRASIDQNVASCDKVVQPLTYGGESNAREVQCHKGSICSVVENDQPISSIEEEVVDKTSQETDAPDSNVINPFDPKIVTEFVRFIARIWQDISGFKKFLCDLPKFTPKSTVQLEDFEYTVLEEIGVGGFGKVYMTYNNADESAYTACALKVIKAPEICVLEHYISSSIQVRIEGLSENVRKSFAKSTKAYLFDDGGCLEMQCYRATLLDLVNLYKVEGQSISEAFALLLTAELINIVERMHWCGIIHGDIKPDNIFCLELNNAQSFLDNQLLAIGDFGRAIDLTVIPPAAAVKFCGSCNTDSFECIQMREKRPWKYQGDYFALANTLHVLIFGSYLNIYKESNTGRWRKTSSFKRSWDQILWSRLFEVLINHEGFERSDSLKDVQSALYKRLAQSRESSDMRDDISRFERVKRITKNR